MKLMKNFLHTETGEGCLGQSMTGTELPGISSSVVQLEEPSPAPPSAREEVPKECTEPQKMHWIKKLKSPHKTYDLNMLPLIILSY